MPERTPPTSDLAVLSALLSAPREGIARSELQQRAGVSPATLVNLLRGGAHENGPGRLGPLVEDVDASGKRPMHHRLRASAAHALLVALFRHEIRFGIGTADGAVFTEADGEPMRVSCEVDEDPWTGLTLAAEHGARILTAYRKRSGLMGDAGFAGVGVSVVSSVEPSTGMFRLGFRGHDDPWTNIKVADELAARFERNGVPGPIVIEKDANLGALAYKRSPAGRDVDPLVYVKWATGLSAGIWSSSLQRGRNGSAGSFAHTPIFQPRNPGAAIPPLWTPHEKHVCRRCGRSDCLEAMIGIDRLLTEAGVELGQGAWRSMRGRALADDASREAAILRYAATLLGRTLGALANVLNPERFAIGGMMTTDLEDLLQRSIRDGIAEIATLPAQRDVDVKFTGLGVLHGAAAAVITAARLNEMLQQPA